VRLVAPCQQSQISRGRDCSYRRKILCTTWVLPRCRRSLSSAVDENALPCARSLLLQGFTPAAVSTWGETGGIPGDAAPFILEHYGINAVSPSAQARHFLLAFTRVGINAYLKEKLGLVQQRQAGQLSGGDLIALAGRTVDLLERLGGVDVRAQHQLRDMALNYVARQTGGGIRQPQIEMLSLQEGFRDLLRARGFVTELCCATQSYG
jgi:hypothetical protein